MKLKPVSLAVAAITAGLALSMTANAGVVKTEGDDIIVSTKNGGLQLKTESGDFSFKVKGKLQWDYAQYDKLYAGLSEDADKGRKGYIRRAEIGVSGKAYKTWKYGLKLEGSNGSQDGDNDGDVTLTDAKLTYTGFKPVEITVGRWGRDYGLENTTSSSWIMGIERSMLFDVLAGDEDNEYGIQFATGGDNYTALLGIHNDNQQDSDNADEERVNSFVFRGTFAPVMEDDMLVHLGFNYYSKNPDKKDSVSLKTGLGVKKIKEKYTLVTVSNVKEDSEYVLEAAAQFQSLQLQGEYAVRDLKSDDSNADGKVSGYYGQASFMLDGGKRSYKDGAFSKPNGGQWEVFARYSYLKAEQDGIDDKKVNSHTLGVNYFPTKNIRASLNYVNGKIDNDVAAGNDDKGTAVVGRLQYVF